jgi:hypothetical protein
MDKVFLQTGLEEFPSTWSTKVTCVHFFNNMRDAHEFLIKFIPTLS